MVTTVGRTRGVSCVVRAMNLQGTCGSGVIMSSMGVRVSGKTVCNFINPGNTKGDAIVGVVLDLVRPSTKRIRLLNRGIADRDCRVFGGINSVVRGPCFCSGVATERGLRLRYRCVKFPGGRQVSRILRLISLRGIRGGRIYRCSLNVGRQLTVTETVLTGPRFLVLSRPVGTLSPRNVHRVQALFRQLGRRSKAAVFVSDRVLSRISLLTSAVKVVRRKGLLARLPVRRVRGRRASCVDLRISSIAHITTLLRGVEVAGFDMLSGRFVRVCSSSVSNGTLSGTVVRGKVNLRDVKHGRSALRSFFFRLARRRG